MKKVIIIAVVIANAFMACKKDRVCECSVTKVGSSTTMASLNVTLPVLGSVPVLDTSFVTTVSDVFSFERTLTNSTKKQAKNNCLDYKEPYKDITTNSAPPLSLVTTETGTRTYDCTLK